MVELIDFINQEKINKKVNGKKTFNYFSKCIIKSIIELNNKFKKIENKTNSIISGINMIYNIFFILIFYSNNIKLTIFLVERAVRGMLPKTRLGRQLFHNLHVYTGTEHSHEAQQPKEIQLVLLI